MLFFDSKRHRSSTASTALMTVLLARLLCRQPSRRTLRLMGCFIRRQSEGDVEVMAWKLHGVFMDLGRDITFQCDGKKRHTQLLSSFVRRQNCFEGNFFLAVQRFKACYKGATVQPWKTIYNITATDGLMLTFVSPLSGKVKKHARTTDRNQSGVLYLQI